jgi:spore maturation protein CgeB
VRILYVAMAHDYGDPTRGPSFEDANFRSALERMGHELVPFDFKMRERAVGRDVMNAELRARADDSSVDASFFFLFEEEIAPATVEAVGDVAGPTISWFADDHWRFESFSRRYARSFDVCVTTDHESVQNYRAAGARNVVLSQWACNRYVYKRVTTELEHGVTFVGQRYGRRPEVVQRIQSAGYDVECWGQGWPAGRLDQREMIRVFSSSAINLNLSNAWQPDYSLRARLGAFARGIELDTRPRPEQIKGRNFEVPGCGGFLLTQRVPRLEDYFVEGEEIALFDAEDDLIPQIRHWLEHPDERAAVAEAGYRRVLAEHTYDHRFEEIFRVAGLA